jgi:ribose transport system substrate-binding protein
MSSKTIALSRNFKTITAAGAICAVGALLAACSSGSSGNTAAPSTGSSGNVSAEASNTVGQYLKEPVLDLTQLKSKPAAGKHLIYIDNSAAPTTITNGQAVAAAAKLLGWTVSTLSYAGDDASLAQTFAQAITDKPDGIILSGEDTADFATALKAADKAGIPVFDGGVADIPTGVSGGGLAGVSLGTNFLTTEGKIAADWIIKASDGNAHVAIVTLPDFKTLVTEDAGFTTELKAQCAKCTVTTINAQITQIGNGLPQLVVSELQSNPSVNYLFYPYGDMSIGVPAALSAANLKVSSVASTASTGTYADLKAGTMVANLTASTQVQGWLEVDVAAHYFATGQPASDDIVPIQILDKSNSSSATLPITPTNYQSQFETAWQVG